MNIASATYMSKQTDVNEKMRAILIDWLVEVHLKFKLMVETLYLTVNLIDRFLEKETITRNKLQLVGVTAMFLASKYEEIYAPECRDFVYISDKAYTREQILSMEGTMLAKLNFQLTTPNAYVFLKRFAKVAGIVSNPRSKTELLASFLVELTLQEYKMLKYLPSTIAASAIYLALKTMGQPAWVRPAFLTSRKPVNLSVCARLVPTSELPCLHCDARLWNTLALLLLLIMPFVVLSRVWSSRNMLAILKARCSLACVTCTRCTRTLQRTVCRQCARSTRRRSMGP